MAITPVPMDLEGSLSNSIPNYAYKICYRSLAVQPHVAHVLSLPTPPEINSAASLDENWPSGEKAPALNMMLPAAFRAKKKGEASQERSPLLDEPVGGRLTGFLYWFPRRESFQFFCRGSVEEKANKWSLHTPTNDSRDEWKVHSLI
jgi:hypothetical protein